MSNLPQTSHDAQRSVSKEMKDLHHSKILAALEVLGEGIGEKIAEQAGMDYHAVMRRLKELTLSGAIYNTLRTSLTSTGRKANIYALKTPTTIIPAPEINYKDFGTTGADYASKIIAGTKQGKLIQQSFFDKMLESSANSDSDGYCLKCRQHPCKC